MTADRDKYRTLTTLAVLLVAAIAAVVSNTHVASLAIRYGQPPWPPTCCPFRSTASWPRC
jgi:hypothetical protein